MKFKDLLISAVKGMDERADAAWLEYLNTLTPEEKRKAILRAQADGNWSAPGFKSISKQARRWVVQLTARMNVDSWGRVKCERWIK